MQQLLIFTLQAAALLGAEGEPKYHTPPASAHQLMREQHHFTLPSPLVADDGSLIRTAEEWNARRRPELIGHWTRILGKLERRPPRTSAGSAMPGPWSRFHASSGRDTPELNSPFPLRSTSTSRTCCWSPRALGHSPPSLPGLRRRQTTGSPRSGGGAWLARHGFVVLTGWSHIRNYREGRNYSKGVHEAVYERFGHWLPMAKMVHDVRREIEFLRGRPEVDASRIGFMGFSLSAKTALYVAAFLPEVAATVSIDPHIALHGDTNYQAPWYLDWQRKFAHIDTPDYPVRELRGTIWSLLDADPSRPGFERNHHELMALCAPRSLMVIGCSTDQISARHSDDRQSLAYVQRAREVYELLEAGDRFEYVAETGGHRATGRRIDLSWQRFLVRWLAPSD